MYELTDPRPDEISILVLGSTDHGHIDHIHFVELRSCTVNGPIALQSALVQFISSENDVF